MSCTLPLILEPEALQSALGRQGILVVDLSATTMYPRYHVPGAVHLEYQHLVRPHPPAMGLLPSAQHIGQVLGSLGVGHDTHVVAYDDEGGGRAARLLWTLEAVGHRCMSLLDGGLTAWANEGFPLEQGIVSAQHCEYSAEIVDNVVADMGYVLGHLNDSSVALVDARSAEEYQGVKRFAARGGHIPGAIHWEWTQAMDRSRNLRLRPASELLAFLDSHGVTTDQEVITYCQTHHRSAFTWLVLRSLGFPRVRGYHGSWSEWGNSPNTPIEQDTPRSA